MSPRTNIFCLVNGFNSGPTNIIPQQRVLNPCIQYCHKNGSRKLVKGSPRPQSAGAPAHTSLSPPKAARTLPPEGIPLPGGRERGGALLIDYVNR